MTSIDITAKRSGEFWVALAEAEKGDQIIYHIGQHCGGAHKRDASMAQAKDEVFLFCKRTGKAEFAYLAIKR